MSVFTEDNLTDVIFYNATPESSFAGTKAEARQLARAMQAAPALAEALREAVAIVEGHPYRSPFVAVEDWKAALKAAGIEV